MGATPNIEFGQAISLGFSNYFVGSGRATRSEYWWFTLFNFILACIPFVNLICLFTFIPGITLGVRRMHDTNRSGWWLLLSIVPLIGLIVIVWLCTEGSREANDFGPPRSETLDG